MGASNGTGPERAEILAPKHGRHAWNAVWLEPHYSARLGNNLMLHPTPQDMGIGELGLGNIFDLLCNS